MNEILERHLASMRRRIRLLLLEKHSLVLGAGGAAAATILVLLSKRYYTLGEPIVLLSIILLSIAAGAIWGMLRKITPFSVARAVEKRTESKERISSAVSLIGSENEMIGALTADAEKHIKGMSPGGVFPYKPGRELAAFGLMIAIFLGSYYIPRLPIVQSPMRRAEVSTMKKEGEKLRKLAKEVEEKASSENKELVSELTEKMERLGRKLESGRMPRKEALLEIKKISKEIEAGRSQLEAKYGISLSPQDSRNRSTPKSTMQVMERIEKEQNSSAKTSGDSSDPQEFRPGLETSTQSSKSMKQAANELREISKELAENMEKRMSEAEKRSTGSSDNSQNKQEGEGKKNSGRASAKRIEEARKKTSEYLSSREKVHVPPELAEYMAHLVESGDFQKTMDLMNALAKKLEGIDLSKLENGSKEEKEKAERTIEELEEALRKMSDALAGTDWNEMAEMLLAATEKLSEMDPEEAAKALMSGGDGGGLGLFPNPFGKGDLGLINGLGMGAKYAADAVAESGRQGENDSQNPSDSESSGNEGENGDGASGGTGEKSSGQGSESLGYIPDALDRLPNKGFITKSISAEGKEGEVYYMGETREAPDSPKGSVVPYRQVYKTYSKSAEKALEKEEVPPAYRKPVREYFQSLQK